MSRCPPLLQCRPHVTYSLNQYHYGADVTDSVTAECWLLRKYIGDNHSPAAVLTAHMRPSTANTSPADVGSNSGESTETPDVSLQCGGSTRHVSITRGHESRSPSPLGQPIGSASVDGPAPVERALLKQRLELRKLASKGCIGGQGAIRCQPTSAHTVRAVALDVAATDLATRGPGTCGAHRGLHKRPAIVITDSYVAKRPCTGLRADGLFSAMVREPRSN